MKKIDLAIEAIKRGEPIIFPTETVYGLGASIFNEKGIKAIFSLKGRPSDNPLIVHIADLEDAKLLSPALSEDFYKLAEAFWPGPLAIVVAKREEITSLVSAGLPTIAIRMPSHPIARELIRKAKAPLAAPSANLSGRPSPTNLADALEDLGDKVSIAIDGGPCEVGIESTVISLVHEKPTLLRPGHITVAELEAVLGQKVFEPPKKGPVMSPGMKYRHYAPKAKVRLHYQKPKEGSYIIPTEKTLFAELRKADREGVDVVQIYCEKSVQQNEALMNRLIKASG